MKISTDWENVQVILYIRTDLSYKEDVVAIVSVNIDAAMYGLAKALVLRWLVPCGETLFKCLKFFLFQERTSIKGIVESHHESIITIPAIIKTIPLKLPFI